MDQARNSNETDITLTPWINKKMLIRTDDQMNKKSGPLTGTIYIDRAQMSRLLREEGDRIQFRKVVFRLKKKNRRMANVQEANNYINIPLAQHF
jgi:hypothetical protein